MDAKRVDEEHIHTRGGGRKVGGGEEKPEKEI
jgi:hypothetical protein